MYPKFMQGQIQRGGGGGGPAEDPGRGPAEFSSKKGGGPNTYSGQFELEINKIFSKKGGRGRTPWTPGSAPVMDICARRVD